MYRSFSLASYLKKKIHLLETEFTAIKVDGIFFFFNWIAALQQYVEMEIERKGKKTVFIRTCLTASAISGPIPSPGKRVAGMGDGAEEKALAAEEIGVEPRTRLNTCVRAIEWLIDLSIPGCCLWFLFNKNKNEKPKRIIFIFNKKRANANAMAHRCL